MRFKLKTEYTQYVRDQIRGGLWFAPSWWSAISKVPPALFQPVIAKRKVPRITFVEDTLKREFHNRNPVLAAFDKGRAGQPNSTVAAAFVQRQLQTMQQGNKNKDEAYNVAMAWLLENGKSMVPRLGLPKEIKEAALLNPEGLQQARRGLDKHFEKQLQDVRSLLDKAVAETKPRSVEGLGANYRSFLPSEDADALQQRQLGSDLDVDTRHVDREAGASAQAGAASGSTPQQASPDVLASREAESAVAAKILSTNQQAASAARAGKAGTPGQQGGPKQ